MASPIGSGNAIISRISDLGRREITLSLFQTNAWQEAWWNEWGRERGVKLLLPGGAERSGVYLHSYSMNHLLRIHCLQFVGTSYRALSTPRTEYNSLGELSRLECVLAEVKGVNWTEAVFSDLDSDTNELNTINKWASENGWYFRYLRSESTHGINTTDTFKRYLAWLGRNTRLKLYNRRSVLESLGDVSEENFWPDRTQEFFELLNEFHLTRWGTPCFNDRSLAFHLKFLNRGVAEGVEPLLMVLCNENRPVSVLYNAFYRGCIYNIQAGFHQSLHPKLALGTLHLGYAIESAFQNPSVHYFDLLAGEGKNTNYKVHLAPDQRSLTTCMVVRSPVFQVLYRVKDLILSLRGRNSNSV